MFFFLFCIVQQPQNNFITFPNIPSFHIDSHIISHINLKRAMNKNNKYSAANMIISATEQLGGVLLGDCNSAMSKKLFNEYSIKTIISIGKEALPLKEKIPKQCYHHFYDIHDNKSQKVPPQLFDQVGEKIEEGRRLGGVLVHCYAGVSRSSSFLIAHIMQKQHKTFQQAKQMVKQKRPCIHPNDTFVHQLNFYQKVLQHRQKERLSKLQEEKAQQINSSLVRTGRKGTRGAVKCADNTAISNSTRKGKSGEQAKKVQLQVIADIHESVHYQQTQNQSSSNQSNLQKNLSQEQKELDTDGGLLQKQYIFLQPSLNNQHNCLDLKITKKAEYCPPQIKIEEKVNKSWDKNQNGFKRQKIVIQQSKKVKQIIHIPQDKKSLGKQKRKEVTGQKKQFPTDTSHKQDKRKTVKQQLKKSLASQKNQCVKVYGAKMIIK